MKPGLEIDWLRYAGSMIVVLVLLFVMFLILKRLKFAQHSRNQTNTMKIIETISMGPRQKIALIQVGSRRVLVGIGANQFTALDSWSEIKAVKGENLVA